MWSLHSRLVESARLDQPEQILANPEFQQLFHKAQGRAPTVDEVRRLVDDGMTGIANERLEWVRAMARTFNRTVDLFRERGVTLLHAVGAVDFLTSDTPVVLVQGTKIGVRGGTGLAVAHEIYMPLSPRVAWQVGGEGGDRLCPPLEVQRMNLWMVRSARHALAAHPETDWRRALGLGRSDVTPS